VIRDRPENLRVVVATNTRRIIRSHFGDASVTEIAAAIDFERSGLYDVLGGRVDISVARLARLAAGLDETPRRFLRQ
jgi:hypothetical protein